MRMSRNFIIALGVFLILGVSAVWSAFSSPAAITFVTDTVKRGSFEQTIDVTGEVQSAKELTLAFGTTGTVFDLTVDVGDHVKAGQVLTELNAVELASALVQAREGVAQAQAELDIKNAGISDEEEAAQRAGVAVAEAQVNAAAIDYANALLEESVGNTADAATVAQSQSDYDQVAAHNEETTEQAAEDLTSALTTGLISIRTGLEKADQVLGVESTLLNDEYEDYVGVIDSTTISDARDAYIEAADSRDRAEDAVLILSTSSSSADVLTTYGLLDLAFDQVLETLLYTSRVLDNSVSQSGTFTNEDLVGLKSSIATQRATVAGDFAALVSAKQTYDTVIREADNRYDDATNALALAKAKQDAGDASRSSAVARTNAARLVQEASLVQAQAKLAQVLAKPRSVDVAGLEASVARAQAEYDGAMARYRQARIVAPIDGVVANVAFDIGEQVSMGEDMITLIADSTAYEIILDVPESDVAKIALGQEATITFDAFGDRTVFTGSVYSIDPAQKVIEGVVFYETKVLLNANQDLSLVKPGMSADVVILTGHRENALFVPSRTVLEKDGVSYVRVPKNDHEFAERTVRTGLRADGGMIEMVEGITEGEAVIISVKTE